VQTAYTLVKRRAVDDELFNLFEVGLNLTAANSVGAKRAVVVKNEQLFYKHFILVKYTHPTIINEKRLVCITKLTIFLQKYLMNLKSFHACRNNYDVVFSAIYCQW